MGRTPVDAGLPSSAAVALLTFLIFFVVLTSSAHGFGQGDPGSSQFHRLRWNAVGGVPAVPTSTVEPDDGRVFAFREELLWSGGGSDDGFTGRVDAPVLPFLNLYGSIGWSRPGPAELALAVPGTAIPETSAAPAFDQQWLGYSGGGVISGGWRQFFASVNTSFTLTDLERAEQPMSALTVEPRLSARASSGSVAGILWLSAMYRTLDDGLERDFDVPGLGTVPLELDVDVKKPWNMRLGTELEIGENFSLTLDGGVTSRRKLVIGFDARF